MPKRPKTICRKVGCNVLIESPGHCADHVKESSSFKSYDENKDPARKKFYSESRWTKASIRQRRRQPLCEHCLEKGIVNEAEMVHHEPSLEILLSKGLDPVNPKYLFSLCDDCHRKEHRGN